MTSADELGRQGRAVLTIHLPAPMSLILSVLRMAQRNLGGCVVDQVGTDWVIRLPPPGFGTQNDLGEQTLMKGGLPADLEARIDRIDEAEPDEEQP